MQRTEHHASFGGRQEVWQHASTSTGTDMKVGVYLPPAALKGEQCPVLYWLSGLTCTEQNFITKAGAQQFAAQHQLILVAPDTSPRGEGVANDDAYDLGQGAGFYQGRNMRLDFLLMMVSPPSASMCTPPAAWLGPSIYLPLAAFGRGAAQRAAI